MLEVMAYMEDDGDMEFELNNNEEFKDLIEEAYSLYSDIYEKILVKRG